MKVLDIVRAAETLALNAAAQDYNPPKSPTEHQENLQKTTTIVMSKHTLDTQPQVSFSFLLSLHSKPLFFHFTITSFLFCLIYFLMFVLNCNINHFIRCCAFILINYCYILWSNLYHFYFKMRKLIILCVVSTCVLIFFQDVSLYKIFHK